MTLTERGQGVIVWLVIAFAFAFGMLLGYVAQQAWHDEAGPPTCVEQSR